MGIKTIRSCLALCGFPLLTLFLLFFPSGGQAASGEDGAFRVSGTVLRAEGAKAEWCLSFTKALDLRDKNRLLAAVTLRKEGKREKLSLRDLSLTETELCVQNLEHRKRYDILLRRIESADGQRLAGVYDSVFVVPDRKPFLAFVADSNLSILPRHVKQKKKNEDEADLFAAGMAHVVRSVNVDQTRLTLYRISEKDLFASAWQQFTLVNLSPSESLYFARTKGRVVFESDLVFGANPNVEQTLVAPLPSDADLIPGLYYLAATPKSKEQNSPGLFAGQWFLVSDLRLSALRLPDGVKVFAGDLEKLSPAANVDVRVVTREGEDIAAGKTGGDGSVLLALDFAEEKASPALLIGQTAAGDVDILDIGRDSSIRMDSLPLPASLQLDRDLYASGSTAVVALRAEDPSGRVFEVKDSALKLLRPDRRVYSEQMVPAGREGIRLLNVSLPMVGKAGTWLFSWQDSGGKVLAERKFHLAREDFDEARLDLSLLRKGEGDAPVFAVKAMDKEGRPLAFKEGLLSLRAGRPRIQGWKGFFFGVAGNSALLVETPFVTGADGMARVEPETGDKSLAEIDSLEASVVLSGAKAEASLTVSAQRFPSLIGIKPLTEGASFAENGLARFEVIALDSSGKRRAENDLRFLVFEEGRSFEWFPSEGHWDYRPLPQHRRIGGGTLAIGSSGETIVSWPVATGQYVLEVTDKDGAVLARQPFEAGRVAPHPVQSDALRIRFVAPPERLEEKRPNPIKIHLDASAFVNVTAFDGRALASTFRFMKAGTHEIDIVPEEGWGQHILLRAQAQFLDSLVPASVESKAFVHKSGRALAPEIAAPREAIAGASAVFPVKVQKIQGRLPTFLSVVASPLPEDGQTDVPVVRLDRVPLDGEGKGQVRLNIPLFSGKLRLAFFVWNETQYGEKIFTIPANPALMIEGTMPERMSLGDRTEVSVRLTNRAGADGVYAYAFTLPSELAVSGAATEGKVNLKKGQSQSLSLSMTAKETVEDVIRLDISGPGQLRASRFWPLTARTERPVGRSVRVQSLEAGRQEEFPSEKGVMAAILSPLPLDEGVVETLENMTLGKPHTTVEIASWLEAAGLWKSAISSLALIGDARIEGLKAAYLRELQMRQNEDGSFSSLAAGGAGDIRATAAALVALQGQAERPVALAAEWLLHKMQNTWFDEGEREARAVALEALSRTKRGDLSAIRYFAETSRDKALSPVGCAFLALALTQGGDGEAATYWIKRAEEAALREAGQAWLVARLLAFNDKVASADLEAILSRWPKIEPDAPFVEKAGALAALAQAAARLGPWTARIGSDEIRETGLYARSLRKGSPTEMLESTQRKLYVLEISEKEDRKAAASSGKGKRGEDLSLQRRFVKLDGEDVSFDLSLNAGAAYVLLIEGEQVEGQEPLRIVLPKNAAFDVALLQDPSLLGRLFSWMPENLARVESFADLPSGYALSIDASRPWRLALLVRASRRGDYALPFLRAFDAKGKERATDQNALRFSVW